MSLPKIAIVGRPNVGKSSLLNCIAGRRISIVEDTPGVTRDRISTPIVLGHGEDAPYVELVDTGGMGIEDHDNLTDHVEGQISFGLRGADVIVFVVDAREGIVSLDRHVAKKLRRIKKSVILVANKIDEAALVTEIEEFRKLGFGAPLAISARHNRNINELLTRMREEVAHLPPAKPLPADLQLAIVGKRNAGKSTLINALAGEDRVIVSEVPGTTRDSVDVQIEFEDRALTLIDTAGVKKKRKLNNDIEFYSQHRSMRSVRRADVVAMVIDASLPVSQVDKNLAGVIMEEHKPVMIVVNKWDLAKNKATPDDYVEYFAKEFPGLAFAPISFISATEGVNISDTINLAYQLWEQANERVTTGILNAALKEILEKRGPSHKSGTKPPKIYYASQVSTAPPTIVCFVNDTRSFDEGYQRFMINQFREYLPFPEVPIRLFLRGRKNQTAAQRLENRNAKQQENFDSDENQNSEN